MDSIKEALFIWDAIQCLFLGFILLFIKNNKRNCILATFFFITGTLVSLQYLFSFKNYLYIIPQLAFVADILRFAIAPTLYLYIFITLKKRLPSYWGLNYLPALLFATYIVFFQLLKYQPFHIKYYAFSLLRPIVLISLSVVFVYYLLKCRILIKTYQPIQPEIKNWVSILRVLLWFKAIPPFYLLALRAYAGFYNKNHIEETHLIIFIGLDSLVMLVLLVQLLRNPFILSLPNNQEVFKPAFNSDNLQINKAYNDSQLAATKVEQARVKDIKINDDNLIRRKIHISPKEAELLLGRLEVLIAQDKVYLNPDLNEKILASAVGIQPYLLSKLLNDHIGETFNVFLNRNRIEEAKRLLISKKSNSFTIYGIALECGYNSESVFYTNFKRYTGTTPKSYKEEHNKLANF